VTWIKIHANTKEWLIKLEWLTWLNINEWDWHSKI
jgi:hypothetical protein